MITTSVLDQIGDRVSGGASVEELSDALPRWHQLSGEESAAVWLLARREAEDPGRRDREQRARALLTPID